MAGPEKSTVLSLISVKEAPEYLVKPSFKAWECYFHPGKVIRNRAQCQKCQLDELTAMSQELGEYK